MIISATRAYLVELANARSPRYLGGMGVEFWDSASYKTTMNRRSRSIICAPLPPNFKKIEQKIDIRGRWYTEQTLGLVTQERFDKPLYPGCGRMNKIWGFYDSIRQNKASNQRKTALNFVCWQGETRNGSGGGVW